MNKPLSSDKYFEGYEDDTGSHSGHPDGINVLMSDNRVEQIAKQELPEETKLPEGLTR
jgi:hypothetical protein